MLRNEPANGIEYFGAYDLLSMTSAEIREDCGFEFEQFYTHMFGILRKHHPEENEVNGLSEAIIAEILLDAFKNNRTTYYGVEQQVSEYFAEHPELFGAQQQITKFRSKTRLIFSGGLGI